MEDKIDLFTEVVMIGNQPFLYFQTTDGGRLVAASQIKSIFPDFRGDGGMLFFTDNDKPIKIPQTPDIIASDLIADEEDDDDQEQPFTQA